jgi:hypothetical protein
VVGQTDIARRVVEPKSGSWRQPFGLELGLLAGEQTRNAGR